MREGHVEVLWREFELRGYSGGEAPNGSMWVSRAQLSQETVSGFLISMVVRSEKISRSLASRGEEAARLSYEDVALAVSAVVAAIRQLPLGRAEREESEIARAIWAEVVRLGYLAKGGPASGYADGLAEILVAVVAWRQQVYAAAPSLDPHVEQSRQRIEDAERAVAVVASVLESLLGSPGDGT